MATRYARSLRGVPRSVNLHTTLTRASQLRARPGGIDLRLVFVSSLPSTSPHRLDKSEPAREAARATPVDAAPTVRQGCARDRTIRRVAAALRTEATIPRFIVVGAGQLPRRYPVSACGLITQIDAGVIEVKGQRRVLRKLPGHLPIVV